MQYQQSFTLDIFHTDNAKYILQLGNKLDENHAMKWHEYYMKIHT